MTTLHEGCTSHRLRCGETHIYPTPCHAPHTLPRTPHPATHPTPCHAPHTLPCTPHPAMHPAPCHAPRTLHAPHHATHPTPCHAPHTLPCTKHPPSSPSLVCEGSSSVPPLTCCCPQVVLVRECSSSVPPLTCCCTQVVLLREAFTLADLKRCLLEALSHTLLLPAGPSHTDWSPPATATCAHTWLPATSPWL